MNTLNRTTANKKLQGKHETLKWMTNNGRLTVRKTAGKYVVTLEDFHTHNVVRTSFATIGGAMVYVDNMRAFYL